MIRQKALKERMRLEADAKQAARWRAWGPYLSERQWGTVREDYSPGGTAWEYFPHDHARSRAYRWGEDGLLGVSDHRQRLCFALALWNGHDPFLKERLFGLTNSQGNHGEDVKEIYYYLDAAPSHAYLKALYKYPQARFPYEDLVEETARRGLTDPEYEIWDTGVFDEGRYFDVEVEYARASPEDWLCQITVTNRGPASAPIHILPHLWFRNTWSWEPGSPRPALLLAGPDRLNLHHPDFPDWSCAWDQPDEILFCENDTHAHAVFGTPWEAGCFKDGIHRALVHGDRSSVKLDRGTKAAAVHQVVLASGASHSVRVRWARGLAELPFQDFDQVMASRRNETDEFYQELQKGIPGEDNRRIQRQAYAGLIWTKQFYHIDVPRWLKGDPGHPPPPASRLQGRNQEWKHLNNADILSMPDKWEYPWYASWDLAFHTLPLANLDADFAKQQLILLTREWYLHPNGQMPAYEWAFGDVNPPVHAWATWRVFQIDRKQRGDEGDLAFLERVFHKLLLNFTWWVNRKDEEGHNLFQGGFLGLDNIGLFDRSKPLPTGGHLHQSDGTSWMAMYSLNLMRISLELARHNPVYQDIATKFFEHFLHIAEAMMHMGDQDLGLWDEEDKFYYDVLHDDERDRHFKLKIRSMVGLIPLFAVETIEPEILEALPEFAGRLRWFLDYRPDLAQLVSRWHVEGKGNRRLLSLCRGHRMKCLLRRMLDATEFLSDYGVRALSKVYEEDPYVFGAMGEVHSVSYQPAESDTWLFGGNSNWRGPIWFPVNYLLIESLQKFHHYYGDDFKVECPTGSGQYLTLLEVSEELGRRLIRIFQRDSQGRRPVFGDSPLFQEDPHFKDHLLFYEYFHGDNGRGVGASHQTGWTALVAKLLQPRAPLH